MSGEVPRSDRPNCPGARCDDHSAPSLGVDGTRQPSQQLTELPRLLLTVEQAASVLALGRTAVYELIHCGRLGSVRIGASRRIPLTALDSFVTELINQSKP